MATMGYLKKMIIDYMDKWFKMEQGLKKDNDLYIDSKKDSMICTLTQRKTQ